VLELKLNSEENTEVNLPNFGLHNDFLDIKPKVQVIKENTEKLSFVKIKTFMQRTLPIK
jgi:hypothetical protein